MRASLLRLTSHTQRARPRHRKGDTAHHSANVCYRQQRAQHCVMRAENVGKDDDVVLVEDKDDERDGERRRKGGLYDDANVIDARVKLLSWYDDVKRDLPWRRRGRATQQLAYEDVDAKFEPTTASTSEDADAKVRRLAELWRERAFEHGNDGRVGVMSDDQYAYGVLVSEIMSQQTQIERVAEYWRRWTTRWPTAECLANATQDEVNEEWAGLGYYRRAKYLLEGAKYVRDKLGGKYPRDVEGLLKVPGVGPYTASAVASIAFGTPAAAVDGNVYRVLTRACMIRGDPLKGTAAKEIRAVADAFVDPARAGDFNQAMMELGATTCAPKNPKCQQCPLRAWCKGVEEEERTSGAFKVTELPETAKKAPKREEQRAFVVIRRRRADADEDEFLLQKRPAKGLLAGLWEFPNVLVAEETDEVFSARPSRDLRDAHSSLSTSLIGDASSAVAVDAKRGKIIHVFSHIRQVMHYQLYDLVTVIKQEDKDEKDEKENIIITDDANATSTSTSTQPLKWYPASAFERDAVFSTSVQKLYANIARAGVGTIAHSGAGKRARDAADVNSRAQPSIAAFFAPKSHPSTTTSAVV